MANSGSKYDTALQMFVQQPADPDLDRLRFLRWLAEGDRLEHRIAGPSTGHFAACIAEEDKRRTVYAAATMSA